jgi:hypothetical protein
MNTSAPCDWWETWNAEAGASFGQRKPLRKTQALHKPARILNETKWFNYQSVTKQIVCLIFGYLMLMVINIMKIFLLSSVYI